MESLKIAILDDYQNAALEVADWSPVAERAEITIFNDPIAPSDIIRILEPYDVLVAMRERTALPRQVIDSLQNLRLIVTTGPANAAIDVDAAVEREIPVLGTEVGSAAASTAEHAWGLILALARNIPIDDVNVRAGQWQRHLCVLLQGKTLGIVGLGNIGSMMPPVAHSLGMETIAWSKNLDAGKAETLGTKPVARRELFSTADFVTVHVKLTDTSHGYVSADDIGAMKPSAFLINTSRSQVIDEAALMNALRSGAIAGAGLDVFEEEPLPSGHPLLDLPNAILTPHVGYVNRDTYETWYEQVIEDIVAFMDGRLLRTVS